MGHREIDGHRIAYETWGSSDAGGAVIFLHGFGGDRHQFAHHARAAAAAGAECLSVDLTSLTEGGTFREIWVEKSVRSAQLHNIMHVVDHASWFARGRPLILVGHSAGGGIVLESAVELQKKGVAPVGLVLLDGVGWPVTDEVASQFRASDTQLLSIRAEPSAWNKHGCIEQTVRAIPRAGVPRGHLWDVKVHKAMHGDPIALSGWMYYLLGLVGTEEAQDAINRLLSSFLCQLLNLQKGEAESPGMASGPFAAELQRLQESGRCSAVDLVEAQPG